ncbi:MAG: BACON domain-containing protein, partial [Candidatus Cryptobacteroides sp.]
MKHLKYIFFFCLSAVACTTELETVFSVSEDLVVVAASGGEEVVHINSSSDWVALASEPWLSVSPANGYGSSDCTIRVDSSLVSTVREGLVRFSPVGQPARSIKVQQWGFDRMIVPEFNEKSIKNTARYSERFFDVKVTTNIDFDVVVESDGQVVDKDKAWISVEDYEVNLDRKARPRTVSLRFNWKMNTEPEKRVAGIRLVPKGDDTVEEALISVVQDAAPRIEDTRAGDSLAILIINEKLQSMTSWDTTENMMHWSDVELWEAEDADLPAPEAVGRIKYVRF